MGMIIFDDGRHDLSPMTDLRAVFEIRTGVFPTLGRITHARSETLVGVWAPQRLAAIVAERSAVPVNQLPIESRQVLLVNGRWLLPSRGGEGDGFSPALNEAIVQQESGDVILVRLTIDGALHFLTTGSLPDEVHVRAAAGQALLTHPWDVIRHRDAAIGHDLHATRLLDTQVPPHGVTVLGDHPVEIHRTAKVYPGVVLDAEHGPVSINEHAVIRPNAVVSGPCRIARHSTVVDRAHIKANTVVGPWCKVGGEVGGTIFQGYSNKSHEGHLGDSWVGEWANFGAGTTNSNLLNTYGEVVMKSRPDGQHRRTGLMFLGAIVGDHVKFAINTRIMTGSVFGTGAMIATTAAPPATVPAFAWLTDAGSRTYRLEKFLEVARAVMARRGVAMSSAMSNAIASIAAA